MKIFFIGFMGSGKTHWGKLTSEKLRMSFFDLDEQITNQEGQPITQIFAEKGDEYFRLVERDILRDVTETNDNFVMACGGGTPCYYNNIEFMNGVGTSIWINTAVDTLFKRLLLEKSTRPLIKDLSDEQLKAFITKKYSDRRIYYEQADIVMDEELFKLEDLVEKIFHA